MMGKYCQILHIGHLDKPPSKYSIPTAPKHAPPELDSLKPSATDVQVRHHGDETAVVLAGANFWFCYQVTVSGHKRATPPQEISGTSIQFHMPKKEWLSSKQKKDTDSVSVTMTVSVAFGNCFANPKTEELPLNEKVKF